MIRGVCRELNIMSILNYILKSVSSLLITRYCLFISWFPFLVNFCSQGGAWPLKTEKRRPRSVQWEMIFLFQFQYVSTIYCSHPQHYEHEFFIFSEMSSSAKQSENYLDRFGMVAG